jgi:beta-mannan synthase
MHSCAVGNLAHVLTVFPLFPAVIVLLPGVWRIQAINDAGGWESDTVVEDMDLSLRVYLKGWRSIYLHDVKCPNELPSTLSAYKTQQFRWLSGPMQIVRKSFANIWFSK